MPLLPPPEHAPWPVLDPSQRAVVEHRGPLIVTGAPGSGRTTTAMAVVADRVAGGLPLDEVLFLAPTRRAASDLRERLSLHLATMEAGQTASGPSVRTAASVAYAILRKRAVLLGEPTPTLISGPEQDLVLSELLAGHAAGDVRGPAWPESVPSGALGLRGFRDELRDLLMRAWEGGLEPEDLVSLGLQAQRPEWVAAAQVYREYRDVTVLRASTPDAGVRLDPAAVVDAATDALLDWADLDLPDHEQPRWRLVVVDDYHEATAATVRLLDVLARGGAEVVLFADPDQAVQTFRGANPRFVSQATGVRGSALGAFGADELTLDRVWRHGPGLREVVERVTAHVRGDVRKHRVAPGRPDLPSAADVHLYRSPAHEISAIAVALREARIYRRTPWSRMAVIVRTGEHASRVRRGLVAAQVPVKAVGAEVALRSEPAVRPLLMALACALDPSKVAEHAVDLLASPIGGLDSVALRRLRRALRAEEVAGGGTRTSDELLVEVLGDPQRSATLPSEQRRPARRLATVLEAGRVALASDNVSVPDVLWAMWDASGLAEPWRRTALAGGAAGARADQDLDAVLALFAAAEQYVDRVPHAAPLDFLDFLQAQDLPADSLAPRGNRAEAVAVLTAASAAGREWDLVVVAGVQEGVWPNLRLRDSLLGAAHLVDVLTGRAVAKESPGEAKLAVLDDELRTFAVAVSRARCRLLVTAVTSAEDRPSAFVDLVRPASIEAGDVDDRVRSVPRSVDLRAVVAAARLEAERDPASPAVALLAHLAAHGVAGADPRSWTGLREVSTARALFDAAGPVALTPSKVQTADSCQLRWALEVAGGTGAGSAEANLGSLLHAIIEESPRATFDELVAALDARWAELGLGDGWQSMSARRAAEPLIARLATYLAKAPDVVAVEAPFQIDLGPVVVRGKIDRLESGGTDRDGTPLVRVVDLKTGSHMDTAEQALRNPQLGLYQLAVDSGGVADIPAGARSGGASLVYINGTAINASIKTQPPLAEGDDPEWVTAMVGRIAEAAVQPRQLATPGDHCTHCGVRRSCPAVADGQVLA